MPFLLSHGRLKAALRPITTTVHLVLSTVIHEKKVVTPDSIAGPNLIRRQSARRSIMELILSSLNLLLVQGRNHTPIPTNPALLEFKLQDFFSFLSYFQAFCLVQKLKDKGKKVYRLCSLDVGTSTTVLKKLQEG